MDKYSIAGLRVRAKFHYDRMIANMPKYKSDFDEEAEIFINITKQMSMEYQDENPHFTLGSCEYSMAGSQFYTQLLDHDGMMLHASSIMMDGNAYLFSARSGTGKSTHTSLWQKVYGKDRAVNFNDDKPAIRYIDGKFYAFGTPWSGKNDESINTKTEIAGITFLSRGENNVIERVAGNTATIDFLNQTVRPTNKNYMLQFMETLDKVLSEVPVYRLKCNMSLEAVETSYNAMSKGIRKNEN